MQRKLRSPFLMNVAGPDLSPLVLHLKVLKAKRTRDETAYSILTKQVVIGFEVKPETRSQRLTASNG